MLNYSLSGRKNGGHVVTLITPFSCHSNQCLIRPFKSQSKKKRCVQFSLWTQTWSIIDL